MSRTDVHAPDWVKQRDPGWRAHYRAGHDHSHGPCDLHFYDGRALWAATNCHLYLVSSDRNIHCGCRLCTGHDDRRADRRHDRHEARRRLREARKGDLE